jgi:hypothetical protein
VFSRQKGQQTWAAGVDDAAAVCNGLSGAGSQDQTPEELQDEVKKLRNDLKDTQ